jgi:sec-independent protein translocase protein TatA
MSDVAIVLVAILVIVLIWRGPKTLPDLGKALGRGIREARRAASDETEEPPEKGPDA